MAGSEKHPAVSYQPLKLLFQLTYVGSIVARLPLWLAVAVLPPLRPHPRWTAKQTLMARLAYVVTDMKSRISVTEKISLHSGKEGDRFQVIQLGTTIPYIYQGLSSTEVKPEPVGATWFPHAPGKDITSKIVVLYLHGGAFIQGDGRTEYCGFPAKTMLELGGVDAVLSLQYRLSGWSGLNPYPAALQDALTAYSFLIHKLGVPACQIVICGDSSGGNLAIALLRYIQEFSDLKIPPPRCATLLSPWVSPFDYVTENNQRKRSDFLPTSFLKWGAHTYAGGLPSSHPYITPLGNPFATQVPIFVNLGTAEIFHDVIQLWTKEMKQVEGNRVEVHTEDAALHDTFLLAEVLGFEDSARKVVSSMEDFIRKC